MHNPHLVFKIGRSCKTTSIIKKTILKRRCNEWLIIDNSLTVIGGLQTYGNVSATGGTLIGNGLNVNGAGTIIQLSVPAGITSSTGFFSGLVDAGTLVADEISTNGQLSSGSLQTGEIYAGPTQISSLQVTGNSNFNTLGANDGTIGTNLTVGSNLTANGSVLNGLGLVFPNIVFNRRINLWGSGNDHQFIVPFNWDLSCF